MKKSKLKEIIKEFVKSNKPQPTPYNPDVETAEPGTETKPVRRRTLTPPTESPETKPKAQKEGEEMDLANKIGKRFSKLSKDQLDESVKSRMQKLAGIVTEGCNGCQKKLKEVKILFKKNFRNNETLFQFLEANIEGFAKDQLEYHQSLTQTVLDYMNYQDHDHNTTFSDLDVNTQQDLISYLVDKGLEYYGEWQSENDDDEFYGIGWNIEIGLVYNWTDKADPGSYNWDEKEFKGREFYSMSYNR